MVAAIHLGIRFVHIVGVAVLLGGAAVLWAALRTEPHGFLRLAKEYEWVFWASMGVMLVTGIGNLGALGAPPPTTRWGSVLTVKLLFVAAFVVGSFLRTLVVLELDRRRSDRVGTVLLRRLYAGTAGLLLIIVALAEVLAHG